MDDNRGKRQKMTAQAARELADHMLGEMEKRLPYDKDQMVEVTPELMMEATTYVVCQKILAAWNSPFDRMAEVADEPMSALDDNSG